MGYEVRIRGSCFIFPNLTAENERCDPSGLQNNCGLGLTCFDNDGSGDGRCATSTDASAGGELTGGFGENGLDLYSFSISERTLFEAQTTDVNGVCDSIDTQLRLFKADFDELSQIAFDDNSGDLFCSRIGQRALEPGEYIISVSSSDGAPLDLYALNITFRDGLPPDMRCDRADVINFCAEGLTCQMTEIDGAGVCREFSPMPVAAETLNEIEPNDNTADAARVVLRIPASISGTVGTDEGDVFVLDVETDTYVEVWTTWPDGGCDWIGTRLYRVDEEILDHHGIWEATSAENWLSYNDDGDIIGCSSIQESLTAGRHYYLVEVRDWGWDTDYVLHVTGLETLAGGERCDAASVQNLCASGLVCVDENRDGDGVCIVAPVD